MCFRVRDGGREDGSSDGGREDGSSDGGREDGGREDGSSDGGANLLKYMEDCFMSLGDKV